MFGATGEFPEGKINADDEGEINIGIGIDPKKNLVVIEFGTPVRWLALPPDLAVSIAKSLTEKAEQCR